MKKAIYFLIAVLLFTACASVRTVDFSRITFGMSKAQVREYIGSPERILVARQTNQGYQEVLQYRTPYDEVYAFEFWNDRLTGYEHLYDDIIYVPGPYPVYLPAWGYPLFPSYPPPGRPRPPVEKPKPEPAPPGRPQPSPRPPSRPENPTQPSRPNPNPSNPTQPSRPNPSPSTPSRPETSNPVTPSRPSTSTPTTRPESNTSSSSSPAQNTRPATNSGSNSSNTRENNTSGGTTRSTENRR